MPEKPVSAVGSTARVVWSDGSDLSEPGGRFSVPDLERRYNRMWTDDRRDPPPSGRWNNSTGRGKDGCCNGFVPVGHVGVRGRRGRRRAGPQEEVRPPRQRRAVDQRGPGGRPAGRGGGPRRPAALEAPATRGREPRREQRHPPTGPCWPTANSAGKNTTASSSGSDSACWGRNPRPTPRRPRLRRNRNPHNRTSKPGAALPAAPPREFHGDERYGRYDAAADQRRPQPQRLLLLLPQEPPRHRPPRRGARRRLHLRRVHRALLLDHRPGEAAPGDRQGLRRRPPVAPHDQGEARPVRHRPEPGQEGPLRRGPQPLQAFEHRRHRRAYRHRSR